MTNEIYWEEEGSKKTFTHPLQKSWISNLDRNIAIIDYGCGYGRATKELYDLGFKNIVGYDPSENLIVRAKSKNPGPYYTTELAETAKFDLVICFGLFTSCPTDVEHSKIMKSINTISHTSSLLFVSDYLTTENPDYSERYNESVLGIYGCFMSGNGIFRHHEPEYFSGLFQNWKLKSEIRITIKSLNDNSIIAHQYQFSKLG